MAKCDVCGKEITFGIRVSHSHRRSNRAWKPNIKRVKAIVNGSPKRIYACTRCLRSGKVTRAVWYGSETLKESSIGRLLFSILLSFYSSLMPIFWTLNLNPEIHIIIQKAPPWQKSIGRSLSIMIFSLWWSFFLFHAGSFRYWNDVSKSGYLPATFLQGM